MRIASLSPAATEILFALGLEKDIVVRDQFSTWPSGAAAIPVLKGHQEIQSELLKPFSPEVVLTGTAVQKRLTDELRADGFSVIHQDPRSVSAVMEGIRHLGTIFEKSKQANDLVLKMQQDLNSIKKKAALLPKKLRIYIEEWPNPPMVSGNWVPELIKIAGGESFPIAKDALSREISLLELQGFDADMMVISWCGAGTLVDTSTIEKREEWGTLRFVREKKIKVIDDSLLNRPGPRIVEGAQHLYGWLFELLH